jgi:UDP-galactopyranose mutase
MSKYDVLVVGAGFAGSVLAREFAESGKKVLIIEKRNHIGGNMYEEIDESGIRIHKYGPHIFHTNKETVFNYLQKYGDWYFYEHRVLGFIDGKIVPIPFNFKSIELLFDGNESSLIKGKLLEFFPEAKKVSIFDLIHHDDEVISKFGKYVYEKVFVNYTAKQWGIAASEVDVSVINRVPVILGYDDRYFQNDFQYMPIDGYTSVFEKMLSHPNIDIKLSTNATDLLSFDFENKNINFENKTFNGPVIYTGPLDGLLSYKYGALPYRSLDLKFENFNMNYFQNKAVINYPNTETYTRITEFKYFSNQLSPTTTILKEYPKPYNHENENSIPYYVIVNSESTALYNKYLDTIKNIENLHLCGRLAEYKYYDMDAVIMRALDLYKEISLKEVENEEIKYYSTSLQS